MWRFRSGAQWCEISRRVRNWSTAYGCSQVGRNVGLFTALPEDLIAEVASQGRKDLSGGRRGPHDRPCPPRRAGVIVDKDVMKPLEEAAAEQEQARPLRHPVVRGRASSMAHRAGPRLRPGSVRQCSGTASGSAKNACSDGQRAYGDPCRGCDKHAMRSVRRLGHVAGVAHHPACRDAAGRGAHADLAGDLYLTYAGVVLAGGQAAARAHTDAGGVAACLLEAVVAPHVQLRFQQGPGVAADQHWTNPPRPRTPAQGA